MLHRKSRSPRRGHTAQGYSISGCHSKLARRKLVSGKEAEETMSELLAPFSTQLIDDDAALVGEGASCKSEVSLG